MSDEQNTGSPEPSSTPNPTEEFKNLKAEMNRKLSNVEETNKRLLEQLQALTQPRQPSSQEPKKVSVFDDEEGYARRIKEEATVEIRRELAQQQAAEAKKQATLNQLFQEFPEIGDMENPLTKRALEIYNSLPEDERQSTVAYRDAVKSAALEQGVRPKSKRAKTEGDDFSLSGSSSGRSAPKKGELTDGHMLAAQLLGLDVSNPETKKSLQSRAERKDWLRYQAPTRKK